MQAGVGSFFFSHFPATMHVGLLAKQHDHPASSEPGSSNLQIPDSGTITRSIATVPILDGADCIEFCLGRFAAAFAANHIIRNEIEQQFAFAAAGTPPRYLLFAAMDAIPYVILRAEVTDLIRLIMRNDAHTEIIKAEGVSAVAVLPDRKEPLSDEKRVFVVDAGCSGRSVAEGLDLFAGLCNLPNRYVRLSLDAACTDGNELMLGFQNHAATRRAVIGNAGATVEH